MKSKVSIIVPMYNSEKTIKKCINSLINQSWSNLDIVLIDDGSYDATLNIVNNISDERIRVFSQENKGVSAARNLGIKNAIGEFLVFVDSDDYVSKNMIENLMIYAKNDSLVFSNTFINDIHSSYELKIFKDNNKSINKENAMKEIISGSAGLVCSKLMSKDVIDKNKLKFNENIFLGEDKLFFLEVASLSKQFYYIDNAFYYYDRKNEKSATNKYQENLIYNFINLQNEIKKVFVSSELYTENNVKFINNKFKACFWDCIDNELINLNILNFFKRVKNTRIILKEIDNKIDLYELEIKSFSDLIMKLSVKYRSLFTCFVLLFLAKLIMIKNNIKERKNAASIKYNNSDL